MTAAPPSTRPSIRSVAAVVVAAICFGTTGTARAKGPSGIDPIVAGFLRLAVGGPLLVALSTRRRRGEDRTRLGGRTHRPAMRPRRPISSVLVAAAAVAVYQVGFFEGLARTGVSLGTMVAIGSGPAFAGVLSWIITHDRPTAIWVAATTIAMAGGALLIGTAVPATVDGLGVALVLLAGFGYALFTVLGRVESQRDGDATEFLGRAFSVGAVLLAPWCIGRSFGWVAQPRGVAVVMWLAIVPTAVAYVLFAYGLRTLSGPVVTTFVLAEPLTAVVLGRFALHEQLRTSQWLGAAIVAVGLGALALPSGRSSAHTTVRP